ncbi:MAG TPA: tetratricopeptide repeat protein [Vicinamibacteria bacterium]
MRVLIVTGALMVVLAPLAQAQSLRDAEYLNAAHEGADYLYRLEHDEAIQYFEELARNYPHHPGPPLAEAYAIMLRELFAKQELELDQFLAPGYFSSGSRREMPVADRQAFQRAIVRSRDLAEKYFAAHAGDPDARYYLAGCEGALGALALTIDRDYMSALRYGKAAYRGERALVEEDPEFWDAYLTVGTYEYVMGNIPWYLKWIAAIAGYRGSEKRGFEYLITAAEKGEFVGNDARVLLMVLYVREGYYDYALQVAQELHERYPENFLLHVNQAQILERKREPARAIEIYLEVVRLAEEGRKNYQKVPLGTFRYTAGLRLIELGARERALELFLGATQDPDTPDRERALSHLRAGEILDLLGERSEAVSQYEEVQKLREFENSHDTASKYLKSPYRR